MIEFLWLIIYLCNWLHDVVWVAFWSIQCLKRLSDCRDIFGLRLPWRILVVFWVYIIFFILPVLLWYCSISWFRILRIFCFIISLLSHKKVVFFSEFTFQGPNLLIFLNDLLFHLIICACFFIDNINLFKIDISLNRRLVCFLFKCINLGVLAEWNILYLFVYHDPFHFLGIKFLL